MTRLNRAPWQRPAPAVTKFGSTIDPKLRQLVKDRAGSRCECCGDPLRGHWECHHRKLRSRGGQDSACNLAALCLHCHKRLHSRPRFATETGFIVSAYDDPAEIPMLLNLSEPVYLTSDGKYRVDEMEAS